MTMRIRRNTKGPRVVVLLALLTAHRVTCIAVTEVSRVVSTKKDGGLSRTYTFDDTKSLDGDREVSSRTHSHKAHNIREALHQVNAALRSTFLPSGYPSRTPQVYLSFSVMSWIQDLSTQLRSVLATQRVLEGVGVGREGATALSALMNFLVRDGCGMAATLVFTSMASSRFKSDVKRWRLFADIMVDVGITLEATATLVPKSMFLPMISVGNMCKAICGVAAGACGGAINLHWAKGSDISDINAKFGAQHTVTGSLGLVFAALFAKSVSTVNQTKLWTLYSLLTLLHIVANMRCMRLIAFDSFNNARMRLVVRDFLKWWEHKESSGMKQPTLPSPQDIAKKEPLFFVGGRLPRLTSCPIYFGESFNELVSRTKKSNMETRSLLMDTPVDQNYVIQAGISPKGRQSIVVSFFAHANPRDQAMAYFHAILLGRELQQLHGPGTYETIRITQDKTEEHFPFAWKAFEQSCVAAGWDLDKTELRSKGFELELITES